MEAISLNAGAQELDLMWGPGHNIVKCAHNNNLTPPTSSRPSHPYKARRREELGTYISFMTHFDLDGMDGFA